jgi:uncharacterized protein YndB with AHSA1/START domain
MKLEAGTVDLERDFAHPAKTVFAAWSSEMAQRTWGDPGEGWHMSFDCFSFRVGESDLCRFGPVDGAEYLNENCYLAIEPERRIVYATSLRNEDMLTFAGTVVVTFEGADDKTRLRLVEQGIYFDGLDSVDGHRAGWEGMLDALGAYL